MKIECVDKTAAKADPSADDDDVDVDVTKAMRKRALLPQCKYRISYEVLVWAIFGVITLLAILDRFLWNVWPRQTFWIGKGTAGGDFTDGLKPGPWTVKVYDIVARVSGRYSISALNILLFTAMNTFAAWFAESWFARRLVDCVDLKDANHRIHKWNGILLCVMTILHVWSILFPVVFERYSVIVNPGTWEWPASERNPPGFKDVNPETGMVMMQVDDVYRIVLMTLMLCVLMPLSIRWLKTRWHLGIHIHRFIMVMYFVDIVRRHTHPHSWIFNTPFFFLWIFDCIAGYFWRREHRPKVHRIFLSEDYMVLFWNQKLGSPGIGSKYFVKMIPSSLLELSHVFTAFENRHGFDMSQGRAWSVGLVIRVYRNPRRPPLGRKDRLSHTLRMYEGEGDLPVNIWGPYPGTMSEKIVRTIHGQEPFCLVAGGSAIGYILDALQVHNGHLSAPMTVLYTTRDAKLYEWVARWASQMLQRIRGENVTMHVALTVGEGGNRDLALKIVQEAEDAVSLEDHMCSPFTDTNSISDPAAKPSSPKETYAKAEQQQKAKVAELKLDMESRLCFQVGRINFGALIPPRSRVYFQGSGGLQQTVHEACRSVKSRLVAGPAFDNGGGSGTGTTPKQSSKKQIVELQENCV